MIRTNTLINVVHELESMFESYQIKNIQINADGTGTATITDKDKNNINYKLLANPFRIQMLEEKRI